MTTSHDQLMPCLGCDDLRCNDCFEQKCRELGYTRAPSDEVARDAARYRAVRKCPTLVMSFGNCSGGAELDDRCDYYLTKLHGHEAAMAEAAEGSDGD